MGAGHILTLSAAAPTHSLLLEDGVTYHSRHQARGTAGGFLISHTGAAATRPLVQNISTARDTFHLLASLWLPATSPSAVTGHCHF